MLTATYDDQLGAMGGAAKGFGLNQEPSLGAPSCSAHRSRPVFFSERLAAPGCSARSSQPIVFSCS